LGLTSAIDNGGGGDMIVGVDLVVLVVALLTLLVHSNTEP